MAANGIMRIQWVVAALLVVMSPVVRADKSRVGKLARELLSARSYDGEPPDVGSLSPIENANLDEAKTRALVALLTPALTHGKLASRRNAASALATLDGEVLKPVTAKLIAALDQEDGPLRESLGLALAHCDGYDDPLFQKALPRLISELHLANPKARARRELARPGRARGGDRRAGSAGARRGRR